MSYQLLKSTRPSKKYSIRSPVGKAIHFGANGSEDYTTHKDTARKQNYINRHAKREDWTETGLQTAGFWSRWLLWNKPSIKESVEDIEKTFSIKIEYT